MCAHLQGRTAVPAVGRVLRRRMVLLTARMLLMYVACVTARVTALLDVCGCVVVVLRRLPS